MRSDTNINCDACGRFISPKRFVKDSGVGWVFVPDSDVSQEEQRWRCPSCVVKEGKPHPGQMVRHEMCCGVY